MSTTLSSSSPRREGWRSRAAFKLMEIDDKDRLSGAAEVVVDLGLPGGWSQVAAKRVGRGQGDRPRPC